MLPKSFASTILALAGACIVMAGASQAADTDPKGAPADPLNSPMWQEMRSQFFGKSPYQFSSAVKVSVPSVLEDQAQVPVTIDARALGNVKKLVVFADLNPVQHTLTMTPFEAAPFVSFRLKVEQATPIRAAALTADGVWHVGGVFVDAAGGGCSSPALARNKPDWALAVGKTRGRAWRQADGMSRFRMSIKHPMDTGLTQDNIPAFYIEEVLVRGASGKTLAKVELREPISEDPTITMMVRLPIGDRAIQVDSKDIDGNRFSSKIRAGWTESRLDIPAAAAE